MALDLVVTARQAGILVDAPLQWPTPFTLDLPPANREEQLKK